MCVSSHVGTFSFFFSFFFFLLLIVKSSYVFNHKAAKSFPLSFSSPSLLFPSFVQDEEILTVYVTGVIIDLATNFSPLESLKVMVAELCRERKRHGPVLQALQKLSEHSSFQVRRFVAVLLGVSLECVSFLAVQESMLLISSSNNYYWCNCNLYVDLMKRR